MAIRCCNGCVAPKRYPGCKANCTDYIIDNAFHQAEREEQRKKKEISYGLAVQRSAGVTKALRDRRYNKDGK